MSQIITGVFKQKLCMGQTCSCSAFRAVSGAIRKMRSFVWPVSQTHFKTSSWLFLSGRIRGLSVPVTQKPLKNDTAKFAKYFPWCSDSSGGENVRKKNPRWACKLLAESCRTDMRELSASPGLDVVVKLPVSAARTCSPRLAACSLAYSRLFLPSTKKSNTLLRPLNVFSRGDKVLFRLWLLCNMQCCPWNCHFILISCTPAWIYH